MSQCSKLNQMKYALYTIAICLTFTACGGNTAEGDSTSAQAESSSPLQNKGVGEIKNVVLNTPLNPDMVNRGEGVYQMKCAACHKLTDQRVVGPGWAGITGKRTPEWIMNMTTNVEMMLEEDPIAIELLEKYNFEYMYNQNLLEEEAREILEYFRLLD